MNCIRYGYKKNSEKVNWNPESFRAIAPPAFEKFSFIRGGWGLGLEGRSYEWRAFSIKPCLWSWILNATGMNFYSFQTRPYSLTCKILWKRHIAFKRRIRYLLCYKLRTFHCFISNIIPLHKFRENLWSLHKIKAPKFPKLMASFRKTVWHIR